MERGSQTMRPRHFCRAETIVVILTDDGMQLRHVDDEPHEVHAGQRKRYRCSNQSVGGRGSNDETQSSVSIAHAVVE